MPGPTTRRLATPCAMRSLRWAPTVFSVSNSPTRSRGSRVVEPTAGPRELDDAALGAAVLASPDRSGDVGRVRRHALVEHPTGAHRPAVVHLAESVGVRDAEVGEELLAELLRAAEHLDPAYLDAGLVDREHEHGETAVLRHVPVGARQTQPPVGPPRTRRPHLGAVHHPFVAVAGRRRERAGDI